MSTKKPTTKATKTKKTKSQRIRRPFPKRDKLMEATGAQGASPLDSANLVDNVNNSTLAVTTTDNAVNVSVPFDGRAIPYLAMGIVLSGIKRGWMNSKSIAEGAYPYYAFRYLIDAFINATQGTFPSFTTAPRWFWELLHSLRPKTERFKTGRISYKASIGANSEGNDVLFPLGVGQDAYSLYWGKPDPTTGSVEGYAMLIPPPIAYDQATNGATSVQNLFDFFMAHGLSERGGDPGTKSWMEHDTSAFAMSYPEWGESFFAPGGLATTVYSERAITSPIMAKFSTYQGSFDSWRGSHQYRKSAGSASYIGPRLMEMSRLPQLKNKVSPVFKFFNFDEFYERLAFTLIQAIINQESTNQTQAPSIPQCPLTWQDFAIMLRQAIIGSFSNEFGQDLRLSNANGASPQVSLLPFTVGPNGVSLSNADATPFFPKFFVESVRAVKRVVIKLKMESMELDLVPILGRPPGSVLPTNYKFETAVGTAVLFKEVTQASINLIDCSSVVGNTVSYLDLNGVTLNTLISDWNQWITTLNCLTGLATIDGEKSASCLSVLTYTSIQRTIQETAVIAPVQVLGSPAPVKQLSKKQLGPIIIGRPPIRSVQKIFPVIPDYFQSTAVASVTSMSPPLATLWKYVQRMTLPAFYVTTEALSGSPSAYQINQVEPYLIPLSNNVAPFGINSNEAASFTTLFNKHVSSAAVDVRPPGSTAKTEMEIDLETLNAKGHGGFFTDIAALLSESLGSPTGAAIARTVGKVTGL